MHAERNCRFRHPGAFCQYEQSHRSRQSRVQCIRFPSTPVYKVIFGPPPSDASPPPFTTSHPITTESSAPPIQDHLPPPSPHTVPPRMKPTTPSAIARVTSPVPRPCSCPLFPHRIVANFTSCESCIQPFTRVIAGTRDVPVAWTPVLCMAYMRGKMSMSSSLTPSSRPVSPGLATGLCRRFRGRRAVPPPPPSVFCREELVLPVAITVDPIPEADARKASDVAPTETKSRYPKGDGELMSKKQLFLRLRLLPTLTTEVAPGPAKGVTVGG